MIYRFIVLSISHSKFSIDHHQLILIKFNECCCCCCCSQHVSCANWIAHLMLYWLKHRGTSCICCHTTTSFMPWWFNHLLSNETRQSMCRSTFSGRKIRSWATCAFSVCWCHWMKWNGVVHSCAISIYGEYNEDSSSRSENILASWEDAWQAELIPE